MKFSGRSSQLSRNALIILLLCGVILMQWPMFANEVKTEMDIRQFLTNPPPIRKIVFASVINEGTSSEKSNFYVGAVDGQRFLLIHTLAPLREGQTIDAAACRSVIARSSKNYYYRTGPIIVANSIDDFKMDVNAERVCRLSQSLLWGCLNLGVEGVEPRSFRWDGDAFTARSIIDPDVKIEYNFTDLQGKPVSEERRRALIARYEAIAKTRHGEVRRDSQGIVTALITHDGLRSAISYSSGRDIIAGFPSRIDMFRGTNAGSLSHRSYIIFSLQISQTSLNDDVFDPSTWLTPGTYAHGVPDKRKSVQVANAVQVPDKKEQKLVLDTAEKEFANNQAFRGRRIISVLFIIIITVCAVVLAVFLMKTTKRQ